MDMYRPATAKPVTVSMPQRTQLMARGPGWALADGEAGNWQVKVLRCDDPVLTWTHMLRSVRSIAGQHGLRPIVIDLRMAERLAGAVLDAAAQLLAELEQFGVRVAVLVGADLVHALRVHRLVQFSAPVHGCCCMTEDEALDWVRRSAPPVPPPLPPPQWLHRPRAQFQAPRV